MTSHAASARPSGGTWIHRSIGCVFAALLLVAGVAAAPAPALGIEDDRIESVIIRTVGANEDVAIVVSNLGGELEGPGYTALPFVAASVPRSAIDDLAADPRVVSITDNGRVEMAAYQGFDPASDDGSLETLNEVAGVYQSWSDGYTGAGVDIAILDTGVDAGVEGLDTPGKVMLGPDLSFDAATDLGHDDVFGHGTHMAGIMAGRDGTAGTPTQPEAQQHLMGVAPDSRVVSVKVGDSQGQTNVAQILAGIDWVVQHQSSDGLNIRVLNLSFGTDQARSYLIDPLSHAVEAAWQSGIVVVVAAGNEGGNGGAITSPATNPFIIAVGASDANGSPTPADDTVAWFSSWGSSTRSPDVVAPGSSVVSLISTDSDLANQNPQGVVNQRLIRGSGTSQAAAAVSGMAALLVERHPNATPDQIKKLFTDSAADIPSAGPLRQGAGTVDLVAAAVMSLPSIADSAQHHVSSLVVACLVGSDQLTPVTSTAPTMATTAVQLDGVSVSPTSSTTADVVVTTDAVASSSGTTETTLIAADTSADCYGGSWSAGTWSGGTWSGGTWSGGTWSGGTWSGGTWSGGTWSGGTWSGGTWSGGTWSGSTWSGATWSAAIWA